MVWNIRVCVHMYVLCSLISLCTLELMYIKGKDVYGVWSRTWTYYTTWSSTSWTALIPNQVNFCSYLLICFFVTQLWLLNPRVASPTLNFIKYNTQVYYASSIPHPIIQRYSDQQISLLSFIITHVPPSDPRCVQVVYNYTLCASSIITTRAPKFSQ